MQTFAAEPAVQGRDSIVIDALSERVWPLIADLMQLEAWGLPWKRWRSHCSMARRSKESAGGDKTEVTFTFFHRPKNLMGRFMNPLIRSDQRKNRRKALQSIKQYAETGDAIKN